MPLDSLSQTTVFPPLAAEIDNLLYDAADLLDREGWVRFNLCSPHGYCALGALNKIRFGDATELAYRDPLIRGALTRVANFLQLKTRPYHRAFDDDDVADGYDVVRWNNIDARDGEAAAAFRSAANAP